MLVDQTAVSSGLVYITHHVWRTQYHQLFRSPFSIMIRHVPLIHREFPPCTRPSGSPTVMHTESTKRPQFYTLYTTYNYGVLPKQSPERLLSFGEHSPKTTRKLETRYLVCIKRGLMFTPQTKQK